MPDACAARCIGQVRRSSLSDSSDPESVPPTSPLLEDRFPLDDYLLAPEEVDVKSLWGKGLLVGDPRLGGRVLR